MFKKAKWIWAFDSDEKDDYAEFTFTVEKHDSEKIYMNISCDSAYAVYIGGKVVAFSFCADYPNYKLYDEVDLTEYCNGKTQVSVQVWHEGENFQTYVAAKAGVIFEVISGGKVVYYSDKNTLSRRMNEYFNGYKKIITGQLGYSFLYDNTVSLSDFSSSVEVEKSYDLKKRPLKGLVLGDRLPVSVIDNGNSVIIDMGREVAGFFEIDIESESAQKVLFAYGEHIKDGKVRRIIGSRDFSVEVVLKAGNNRYMNAFRRIAGRYIEIFAESPIKVNYLGIRPVYYPVERNDIKFGDPLTDKIYEVCVDTLTLCMHEHYEDCPWREQAMYALDGRNQMLCGYYAFKGGNAEYVRANLVLMSKGIRDDGLLPICFPSGTDVPIPFFSLWYVIQISEYIEYTGDRSILSDTEGVLRRISGVFENMTEENGLIPSFPYPYWNFYEWADESNNEWQITRTKDEPYEKTYDLILNCAYILASEAFCKIFGETHDNSLRRKAIQNRFFDGKNYILHTRTDKYSQLGNAMAILAGVGGKEVAKNIICDENAIKATLSMRGIVYDALLKLGDEYEKYILDDIKFNYKKMLDEGATSFWETEKGSEDFFGAGSLCHGWSAIPIFYFIKLLR